MQDLVSFQEERQKQMEEQSKQKAEAIKFARELYYKQKNMTLPEAPKTVKPKTSDIFKVSKIDIPVRESNTITISHTPRIFPTPERESMKADEEKVQLNFCSII